MKAVKFCLLFCLLLSVVCIPASAQSDEVTEDILEDFFEILPEGEAGLEDSSELLSRVGVDGLISELVSVFRDGGGAVFSFLALLFGISLIFILAEHSPYSFGALEGAVSSGVSVAGALIIFSRLSPIVQSVRSGIEELAMFFSSILPVFSAVNVASGNMNTASVQSFNMNLTLGIVGYGASAVLLPLALALFALALIGSIDSGPLSSAAKSIKSIFNWALGIGTTVILAAISMQSILASSADAVYLRAAKYAASGIPIVGSTVSGALSTLAGGLGYVKSTVGIGSVVVILTLSIAPIIMLLLYRFSFSVCIGFLDLFGCTGGVRCFSAFRTAFDGVISIYVLSAVIYVFEIIVFMKSGVTVFG